MKKLLLLISVFTLNLFSQDDRLDELPFEDEDLQEVKTPYFAVAGGYTFNVGIINIDEVNTLFRNFSFSDNVMLEEISSPLIMHGGGGFTAIPFWKNIRVGFEAWGGSNVTEEISNEDMQNPLTRKGELNLSHTSMHVDYGYVVTDGLAILGGLKIGASSMEILISENPASYDWNNFNGNTNYDLLQLERRWLFVAPQVSIEWAATKFLMVQAQFSYTLNFDNPIAAEEDKGWKANRSIVVDNAPDGLSTNGLNARLGIFLGLFNY